MAKYPMSMPKMPKKLPPLNDKDPSVKPKLRGAVMAKLKGAAC